MKYAQLNVKALAAWKSALASRSPEVWSIVYNFLWELRMFKLIKSSKIIDSIVFPQLDNLKQYLAKIDEGYLLRKALVICEENYGERHEKTLNIVNYLGDYMRRNLRLKDYSTEDANEVIDLFSRVAHGYEINYGKRHPITLREMHHLAHQYDMLKNPIQAEILERRVLDYRREVLGLEHTDTLESQLMLGALLQPRGEYKEAETLYQDALNRKEKILGVRHLSTLESVRILGKLLEDKGDYVESEIMYRRALEGGEEELVADHPFTQEIVNNLARLSVKKEDYKAAELFYRRDLAIKEKALGPEHSRTLSRVNNLGICLNEQNRRPDAIKLLRSYASHSPETEDTLAYNLACYECLEGNTDEAKRLIAAHLKKHPESKDSAIKDEDFAAIRDWIENL